MRRRRAVGQDELQRRRDVAAQLSASHPGRALHHPHVVGFRDREVDEHRVHGRHRGQQGRLSLADEVAAVDRDLADDSRDRGLDDGVREVEVGADHGGLGRLDRSLRQEDSRALVEDRVLERGCGGLDVGGGRLFPGDRRVQILLRDRLLLGERTVTGHVLTDLAEVGLGLIELGARTIDDRDVVGARQIGLRLGELGAGELQRRPVFFLLDHEQHLTLLDLGALPEPHLLEHAGDTSPDLHGRHRLGARHEVAQDRRVALYHPRDHDGRRGRDGRWLCVFRRLGAITTGDEQPRAEHDRERAPQPEVAHGFPFLGGYSGEAEITYMSWSAMVGRPRSPNHFS